jgi:hypothetical protein
MPYLSGFNNDIFISYASVDNEPDPQGVRWVSRFRDDVYTALRQRLGQDVGIFFDQTDFRATDVLPRLLESARASAIFLAVCSPSYLLRDWTRKELTAFYEAAKAGGGPNRLVTIELLRVEEGSLPPELMNLKRTRFYTTDKDSAIDFKLTPASERFKELYNERLLQLATPLVWLLREIHDREQGPPAAVRVDQGPPAAVRVDQVPPTPARVDQVPPTSVRVDQVRPAPVRVDQAKESLPDRGERVEIMSEPRTALLAQVTDDVYDDRQRVSSYLEDFGINVVPAGEYPESGSKFASAVDADLQKADLFVQLLGRVRSNKPPDLRAQGEPPKSYAQFQYDAALRRGIPILQWRHPDMNLDKIPPVNWDRLLLQSPDVRVMGLQEFMKEIRGKVEEINRLKELTHQKAGDQTVTDGFIFINADRVDQELAQALFKVFNDHSWPAVVPMDDSSASAKDIQDDLEANLIDCMGVFLLYGRAPLGWVRAQSRQIMKLECRRSQPLRVKTIVCGPPPAKPNVGVSGFDVVDWQDGATAERVGKIIKELRV